MVTQALWGRTRGKYDSQHRIPGHLTEAIAFSHMIHIVTFSVAAIKMPTKSLWEEWFVLTHSPGWRGTHSRKTGHTLQLGNREVKAGVVPTPNSL